MNQLESQREMGQATRAAVPISVLRRGRLPLGGCDPVKKPHELEHVSWPVGHLKGRHAPVAFSSITSRSSSGSSKGISSSPPCEKKQSAMAKAKRDKSLNWLNPGSNDLLHMWPRFSLENHARTHIEHPSLNKGTV